MKNRYDISYPKFKYENECKGVIIIRAENLTF